MAELFLNDIDEVVLERLRERAEDHGCSPSCEASRILSREVIPPPKGSWAAADAIFARLAASGKTMSDSVELIREDRQR